MLKFIYILWTLGALAIFGAIWGYTGGWESYLLIMRLSFPLGLGCLFLGFTKIKFEDFGFFITFYLIWVLVVGTLFCIAAGLPGGGWDMDYVFIMTSWLIAPLGLHFTIQGLISNKKLIFLGLGVLAPFMFLVVGYYVDYFIGLAKPKEPICFLGGKKVDCEEKRMCIKGYDLDTCHEIYEQHREHEIQESIKKDKRIPNDNQRSNH